MLRSLFRALKSSQTHRNAVCFAWMDPKDDLKLYSPPPEVRGMTSLNREVFTRNITVQALRVPVKVLNKVVKSLKNVIIQRPGLSRVVPDREGNSDCRLVLLDPHKVSSPSSFSGAEEEALRSFSVPLELQDYQLTLGYENLKSEEVLEAVLPLGQDVTSGFSRVGHIAHMNLREHQLPYRNLIGQVIMDKNPGVTCVVNKTNTIDSTYRNFKMEVLAGEENMVAKVKENGVTYEFDFSRVYWNPRLSTEHQRIVQQVKPGDTVFDVFAGVGPFAIPAARCGANVLANDLNPESYRWLEHNCKLNKVENRVRTFNLDGRAFIQGPLRQELPALLKQKVAIHVVMNLPALAIDFLDAFRVLLQHEPPSDSQLPTVHCYGFSKDDDPARDVTQRASEAVGFSLENRSSVHFVRNVAPNKDMMCVSFSIPKQVLYNSEPTLTVLISECANEPATKKQKCEEAAQTT
ncbi:tRNA (guanine(37)-N1)-methyltransferase isoform X1 [Boleophthalmus pectinirostris]|uniref:tRNA (guanine(37)-N1)-methyltransferase isoform X1 n=1 Tax=Boleophthalmus pectinirostris TaxID=150288 RepID=UPI002431EAB1|nr:tRNA (guanine(37)-N1)-methyltransferase isoform X1 [Boleophthalmus pectinirostris]